MLQAKDVRVEDNHGVVSVFVPDYKRGAETVIHLTSSVEGPVITTRTRKLPEQREAVLVGVKFGIPDEYTPHEVAAKSVQQYTYEADSALNLTIGDRVVVPTAYWRVDTEAGTRERHAVVSSLTPLPPQPTLRLKRVLRRA